MNYLVDLLIQLHAESGNIVFIGVSLVITVLLCWKAIPSTTDLMVNNAAGIAGRKFGKHSRTLVINASTNNPELFSMAVSLGSRRMGGWANPLGSLLANVYLMYGVGLLWVYFRFTLTGQHDKRRTLSRLLWQERKLLAWHLIVAFGTFTCGLLALKIMQGSFTVAESTGKNIDSASAAVELPTTGIAALIALGLLVFGVLFFLAMEKRLKRKRPQLFLEIDDSEHGHSILGFLGGTAGLIITCTVMNALFIAWSDIYHTGLTAVFGVAVFAGLHYFLGALITSLPELRVATSNYCKLTAADINTALASASYSNFTNLVLCALGLAVFIGLSYFDYVMPWE